MASFGHGLNGALLVVEDDAVSRETLRCILARRYPQLALHFAENGESGLALFGSSRPDVVLTDLVMPGMSGIEMAEEIRRLAPDAPIIVLTGNSDTSELLHSIRLGISRYVLKPIECDPLFEAVEEAFARIALERQVRAQHEALQAREAQYRTIFENSVVGLLLIGEDGGILEANPEACTICGRSAEELRLMRWHELMDPSDGALSALVHAPGDFHRELRVLRGDGRAVPVEVSAASYRSAEGSARSTLVVRNISKRLYAEQAALLAQKDWERTFDASSDPIMIIDSEFRIRQANSAVAALVGLPLEETLGKTCTECLHRSALPTLRCPHALLMQDGLPHSAEVYEPTLGKHLAVSVTPLFDPMGNLVGSVHFSKDITERKEAEVALRESEARYRGLFNSLQEGFSLLETALERSRFDYRFVEVNPAFETLVGRSRSQLIGRSIRGVLPDLGEEFLGRLAEVARTGVAVTMEQHRIGERQLEVHAYVPARGQLAVLYADVSERRKLQEEREKNARLESLGVLAGGLAHDFNNILTAIAGNISLARFKLEGAPDAAARLEESEKAVAKAAALTRQLLTFARGGAPVRKSVSAAELIGEAVSLFLSGTSCKAELRLPEDLWGLHADGGQINQALHNLLLNAVQAMPAGGIISIGASNVTLPSTDSQGLPPGRYLKIVIADQGIGIPPEVLPKIFDPYFTTKSTGSGLGLASVFSVVKRHNGAITASSQPGVGTSFEILLPALDQERAAEVAPPPRLVPLTGGKTVLVMDDEETIRMVAVRMLKVMGYSATACCDGEEAVRLYREQMERGEPFNAVILDMTVPGAMGGKDAAQRIRELDPDAVIVISSGYFGDFLTDRKNEALASGMVAKPYNLHQLSEVLAHVLKKHSA